ncbi:MAG TPA: aminotransferase class III-fold pyridoxal phosphate-dependent enzyme [Candidatus Dormibacteraeota bacterium]|jgi:glutamate-1-semialdehyde aminotransferase|nr:aminotransferase class III-fold pyridoxal phosphate-dependent enzyme [Candidatus Dormibacteraeota bacterium]
MSEPPTVGEEIKGLELGESLNLWGEAARLIPGGSQTNSKRPSAFSFGRYPIFISRGRGSHLCDVDGNEYLDLVGALGPISLGYCHPAVDAAVREQLELGTSSGLLWPVEIEAARGLVEAMPCAAGDPSGTVRFFKGGGEATAAAARIARAHTGRHVILNAGYRGWPDTWAAGRDDAVPPDLRRYLVPFELGDAEGLERLLAEHRGQVAAIFTNLPYDGSAGAGYLRAARRLADASGALLVFDEIVHGFRLAVGGMQEHFGVVPDLACFAKAMANGMPLAAVIGRADVMEAILNCQVSITYGGEPLSLAACAAVMREYRERDVIGHLWRIGEMLMEGLNHVGEESGVPFRCCGHAPMSAMALDLAPDQVAPAWDLFLGEAARRGVLFRRGGLNMVTLAHTPDDVQVAVEAAAGALESLRRAGFTSAAGGGGDQRVGAWTR